MDFMGKKLEDIIVTLPFQDGTSLECGVYSYLRCIPLNIRFAYYGNGIFRG